MPTKKHTAGFSLVETMGSVVITGFALTIALASLLNIQNNRQKQMTQDELDGNLNQVTQRMQYEIRLSSLADMTFSPVDAVQYNAVSFPVNKPSILIRNESGNIQWDETIIYHLRETTGADGKKNSQLLKTRFSPRNNALSSASRQAQLNSVVTQGDGSLAENSENSTTSVVLENISSLKIIPQSFKYDGYSATPELDKQAHFGTFNLDAGMHKVRFTATGKSPNSSGYKLGIDTLHFSASEKDREAENAGASGTPTPEIVFDSSGHSSGYKQMVLNATGSGNALELEFYNDRWEESNFSPDISGSTSSNITRGSIDMTYDPPEFALKLSGSVTNQVALEQTLGIERTNSTSLLFRGAVVRNIIKGDRMSDPGSGTLINDGAGCRISFSKGTTGSSTDHLSIIKASIATLASNTKLTPNIINDSVSITFEGAAGCSISSAKPVWSDLINFPISSEKNYAVTFLISDSTGKYSPQIWGANTPNVTNSFMISEIDGANQQDLDRQNWTSRTYTNLPWLVGIESIFTSYPASGTYTSAAYDTMMEKPNLDSIDWIADKPSGTSLSIKARSASKSDMSDAKSWNQISPITSPGSLNNISYLRYVQYHVEMYSNTKGQHTPKLLGLAIQWPGETRMVNLGGTLQNGPNYGRYEASVDGQQLNSPLRIQIGVEKNIRAQKGATITLSSESTIQLNPRNKD